MGSYTVKPGESWASIAGTIYGNQRWLIELAQKNGGINRVLRPGDVIDAPDFDTSTQPVITNDQWAAVPTGYSNGQAQYGNSGGAAAGPVVPSFKPPAVPSFGATGGKPKGKTNVGDPYSGIPNQARGGAGPTTYYGGYNTAPTALPGGTGYSGAGPTNGVPAAARQQGKATQGPFQTSQGAIHQGARGVASGPFPGSVANAHPYAQTGIAQGPATSALGNVWNQTVGALSNAASSIMRGGNLGARDPNGRGVGTAIANALPKNGTQGPFQTDQNAIHQAANNPSSPYNAATPGPVPTSASDRSWIAMAARWIGGGITDYAKTGNRNSLPKTISARVAAELPWYDAGFASSEEYLNALGYQMGPDGNWVRYDPQRRSGYSGQTYAASSGGGGGGGYGGGYTRGPAAGGYGGDPLGLVNWRLSG